MVAERAEGDEQEIEAEPLRPAPAVVEAGGARHQRGEGEGSPVKHGGERSRVGGEGQREQSGGGDGAARRPAAQHVRPDEEHEAEHDQSEQAERRAGGAKVEEKIGQSDQGGRPDQLEDEAVIAAEPGSLSLGHRRRPLLPLMAGTMAAARSAMIRARWMHCLHAVQKRCRCLGRFRLA